MMDVAIRDEVIDLDQLLKLAGLVGSGGEAKYLIQSGEVCVNGEVEMRRRRKVRVGDVVSVTDAEEIRVTGRGGET
ncbi:MAG: RNA-binding protein [Planctomycetes bacterium]|nr:RNA-binding protein [Planctomycetota bacterium]